MKQRKFSKLIVLSALTGMLLNPINALAVALPDTLKPKPITPGGTSVGSTVLVPTTRDTVDDSAPTGTAGPDTTEPASGGPIAACSAKILTDSAIGIVIKALGLVDSGSGLPVTKGSFAGNLADTIETPVALGEYLDKNCLDPAARAIYKKMLLQTEQSVFNWANNGFKGGPLDGNTFIDDIEGYFGTIKDAATETWISDQNKNNPFYDQIVSAVYQSARSGSKDTEPDLAEAIVAAECKTYQDSKRGGIIPGDTSEYTNTSGFGGLVNRVRGFLGGSTVPTNNPGFQNNGFKSQRSGSQLEGGTFYYNFLFAKKAFAQTNRLDGILDDESFRDSVARDLYGSNPDVPVSEASFVSDEQASQIAREQGTPCNRKITTADEKRAIIAAYQDDQILIGPKYEWEVMGKSFAPNNCRDCVTRSAVLAKETSAQKAEANEVKNLTFPSGNTGVRTCVSFLPRVEGDTDRRCRVDGWRTVTPGSVVASQLTSALAVPLENLNKMTGTGTFSDLAQAVLSGLMGGLTNQLINSTNGLLSFNGKGSGSSRGDFTKGVATLSNTNTPIVDVRTSTNRTNTYIGLLEQNKNNLESIVSSTIVAQTTCTQILRLLKNSSATLDSTDIVDNHRCRINPATLDYKSDPTAAVKLSQNLLYKEVEQLDGTRGQIDQVTIAIQNTKSTLSSLRRSETKYKNSTDPNRENIFGSELASLIISIPGDDSVELTQTQANLLTARKLAISRLEAELAAELAELK